jgi:hypothetical protein
MPAILEDDAWSTWLGEDGATPPAAKAMLKTMGRRELAGGAGAEEAETAQITPCRGDIVQPIYPCMTCR